MIEKNIRKEVYYEQKEKLKEYVDKKWDNHELKNYHFLSANLSKCLPNIPKEKHKSIYHNILSYRALQGIDTHFYNSFNSIKGVDTVSAKIKQQKLPGIFVSFHLGSFRSAMAFLIKANLNVVLIIDPLPFQIQKDDIINQYKKIKDFFNSTSDLIIYPADRKDLSIQILSKTKENYSVLAFVDGNTGMNGAFNQKNAVKVNFLGQKVFFRKGLAMLSYYTKCPLIPILSYYDEDDYPHWEIKNPIIPNLELNAQDYATSATVKVFKILEDALKSYPDQWEGWLYLHKFLDIELKNDKEILEYTNNGNRLEINPNIGLFAYDEKYYVLNKDTYAIIELSKEIFIKLNQTVFFDVNNEDTDNIIFLLKKNILHLNLIKNATV